jgi:two-component system, response regulator
MTNNYVLLVEDNSDDVALTEIAFKKAQITHKLVVASNGRQALNYLFSHDSPARGDGDNKPGLILLDLKLPIVSGLDVLKEIKAKGDTAQIPVIVLTSSSEERDQTESYRLGACDYIRKPTSLLMFIEIVKEIKAKYLKAG